MVEYFNKTQRKLLRGLAYSTGIFFVVLLILMILLVLTKSDFEEIDSWLELIIYILLFSLGHSIFILVLAFFSGYYEYQFKDRTFSKAPFNQLSSIGFNKIKILEKSLWVLLEEVFVAKVNNYWVVIEIFSKKEIGFNFLYKNPGSIDPRMIQINLREAGKTYSSAGLLINVPLDSFWSTGIYDIQSMLESVTRQLESAKIVATSTFSTYEDEVKSRLLAKAFAGG